MQTSQTTDTVITNLLQQLISHCKNLCLLIKEDLDYFKNNQYEAINQSNQQKTETLSQLSSLAQQLSHECPDGLTQRIEQSTKQLELNQLVQEWITQVKECDHIITENSHIVFSNLQMLKEAWDHLARVNPHNIYNEKGKMIHYSSTL